MTGLLLGWFGQRRGWWFRNKPRGLTDDQKALYLAVRNSARAFDQRMWVEHEAGIRAMGYTYETWMQMGDDIFYKQHPEMRGETCENLQTPKWLRTLIQNEAR